MGRATSCILPLLLAAVSTGCGTSPTLATYRGDDRLETFRQADFVRVFRIHVPTRTAKGPAFPLVLALHGTGQTSEILQTDTGLDQAADSAGFIVVYLEAAVGGWDITGSLANLGLDELAYVRQVIRRVDELYVVDLNRVIAVGLSNGGVFAQYLACHLSDRVMGFVSVSASMPKVMADECTPTRPISALYILGTADPEFPVDGDALVRSADATLDVWRQNARCDGSRSRSAFPDVPGDGTTAWWSRYRPCANGAVVWLDSIVGGGHVWPGSVVPDPPSRGPSTLDLSANAEISRFLRATTRE